MLRAHAARNSNDCLGLTADLGDSAAPVSSRTTGTARTAQSRRSHEDFVAAVRPVRPAIRCASEGTAWTKVGRADEAAVRPESADVGFRFGKTS
ncbi:MAG: hypothetical protein AAFR21_14665 [Pseudomonadota bacterium]